MNKYHPQALVVLGGGIDARGTLSDISAARLHYALTIYKQQPLPIILSGKWSLLADTPPLMSEAAAMRAYALTQHIPQDDLLIEDQSMETIGNAYFSDKRYLAPRGWRQIGIVTSAFHTDRAIYAFSKVLGKSVRFKILTAPDQVSPAEAPAMRKREQIILTFTKRLLDPITPGDRTAICKVLQKLPGYSNEPAYTKTEILKLLEGAEGLGNTYNTT